MNIALVGNPNSGKTTLFNELTGSNQSVGNWPGVTVEKKIGKIKLNQTTYNIIDLPGIYSLSTMSVDEVITREYIEKGDVDAIINIVDASNLERNLFLTLQLLEIGKPMVVALNMMDVLAAKKEKLNVELLSQYLNVPIVPIVASKAKGVRACFNLAVLQKDKPPEPLDFYSDKTKSIINKVSQDMDWDINSQLSTIIRFIEEGPEASLNLEVDLIKLADLNEWIEHEFVGDRKSVV